MLIVFGLFLFCTGPSATAGPQCTKIPGNLKQIDAGAGEVYGLTNDNSIYHWVNDEWIQVPGKLIHVTVGPAGVWGVGIGNNVYKWQDNTWILVSGPLKQVDAGGNKFLSGANAQDLIYCLNQDQTLSRATDLNYINFEGWLKYYSCGPIGCWGVNSANNIFYRYGVTPTACQGNRWKQIEDSLVMVEVGTDGSVFGVNSAGDVYYREGISANNPIGSSWTKLDFCGTFRHVSYDAGDLWLLSQTGDIFKCNVNGSVVPVR